MGLQTAPGFISLTGFQHPAELMRNINKANFGQTGAIRPGHFAVTPTGVTRQVSIAPGQAFLLGTETASQGGYFTWAEAAQTMVFANPSANARIDALIMRVADPQYGTIPGQPQATFEIVQGTPNASPVAPADSLFNVGGANYIPGAWWRIADVRTNVGNTTIPSNQITHNLRYSRSPGGTIFCTSTTRPTSAVPGDRAYEVDTATPIVYGSDSLWHIEGRILKSRYNFTGTGNTIAGTETNIPNMALPSITVKNGRRYAFEGTIGVSCSASAGEVFWFRVRYGTAVSGTLVAQSTFIVISGTADTHHTFTLHWDCTADVTNTTFYFSAIRAGGAGVIGVYEYATMHTAWRMREIDFSASA